MGLPYRTFTESTTLMALLTASKITTADLGSYYNLSYRDVIGRHQWAGRISRVMVNTVDPYTTGTCTATLDSTTVTGSSTVWTSGMVGRYIRINSVDQYYKVATFVSTTSITIEKAWPFATASAVTYEIFGLDYALPNDCEYPMPYVVESNAMGETNMNAVNVTDPARTSTGGTGVAWISKGFDSSGNQLVEFWPRFSTATSIHVPYYTRVNDLSGSSTPIVPAELVETKALEWCFEHLAVKFGDAVYTSRVQAYDAKFKDMLEKCIEEDYQKHGLPRAVQPHEVMGPGGHSWYVTHDVAVLLTAGLVGLLSLTPWLVVVL